MMNASPAGFAWVPRLLGVLTALFLGVFALDAFEAGRPLVQSLPGFAIHLVPTLVLLLAVAVSWRRDWVGGVIFVALSLLYALKAAPRFDWILTVSGPLLFVGMLFFWSWSRRRAAVQAR